jgi:nicotinamidase-related amidase
MLHEREIDTVVLCGVDTDACVMATALDAFDHGLRPLVLSDLCASSGGDSYHQAALMLLERNIGRRQLSTSKVAIDEVGNVTNAHVCLHLSLE